MPGSSATRGTLVAGVWLGNDDGDADQARLRRQPAGRDLDTAS